MATVIGVLAATAFTVGGTAVTYGGLLTAVALGASAYSALSSSDSGGSTTTVNKVNQVADKTSAQQAEQLDAAKIGDEESESEKQKRLSAKAKFKIDKIDKTADAEPAESGLAIDADPKKVTGVQI